MNSNVCFSGFRNTVDDCTGSDAVYTVNQSPHRYVIIELSRNNQTQTLKGVILWPLYHIISFRWQMFLQIARIFMNLTNLSFFLFFNRTFELIPNKKSDSPDEDSSIHDARLLIPTLRDYFKAHPLIDPKTFLGDAAFDSVSIYEQLLSGDTFGENKHFSKAYIPLNERSKLKNPDFTINADGIPCCPKSPDLPMKPEGTAKTRAGLTRYKFICPKTEWIYNPEAQKAHRECKCENSCTSSACGRMVYLQQQSKKISGFS